MSVKKFKRNEHGRDLIVGDIHGCWQKLMSVLSSIKFDLTKDRLFSVGDLVDRGPDSEFVVEWLDEPWFNAVRGNHENLTILGNGKGSDHQMYVHMMNGGEWFYKLEAGKRMQIVDRLDALPYAIELETLEGMVGIVHAECPCDSWSDFSQLVVWPGAVQKACTWNRERIAEDATEPVAGVRAVVCGHTPVDEVTRSGNHIWIDTAGWFRGGKFTILDAATLQEVEAK